ncbi:MAG: stage II sporulation protein D [Emergencia sp.]|nr:stage II sporulation protein D [Emergencia sp.]
MFHHGKLNRQHAVIYIISMVILMVVLPCLAIRLFPALVKDSPDAAYDGLMPDTVRLYRTAKDRFDVIPFEKYIEGVVASEMPSSFEYEALKAQAVASRTYALGRILAGAQLCDSVHCQVYRDDNIDEKVSKAVKETRGQVLLYKGKLAAHALYFSSSAGPTENSQDVFSGTYAYLVSVDSSYEPGATHKKEKTTMTVSAFSKKIKKAFPEKDFGTIKKSSIKIKSRTEGGRVAVVKVGKEILAGSDIRSALNLYSTRFEISFSGSKKIIITTAGSGHGVGMSQYGANGLAKKGKDYKQILSHYYRKTAVSTKNKSGN